MNRKLYLLLLFALLAVLTWPAMTSASDLGVSSLPLTVDDWTRLTTSTAQDTSPTWSADGSHIAWVRRTGWNWNIWEMDSIDGSNKTMIPSTYHGGNPDYSPDGQKLIHEIYRSDTRIDFIVVDLGTGDRTVIRTTGYNQHPRWSPDGSKILFQNADHLEGTYHIYVMDADGSNVTQLTHEGWMNRMGGWSPDGSKIVFDSDRDGDYRNQLRNIYVMDADGSNQTQLTEGGNDGSAKWSPNDDYIAFARTDGIYIMHPDGTNITRVIEGNTAYPDLSPDGKRIAFRALVDGNYDIYTVELVLNQPPDCSGASPSVDTLWPPNHRFEAVDVVGVSDPDGDDLTITIDGIFQDEPVDGTGDGSFVPDGQGLGSSTAEVRRERKGSGNGRVYHIYFTADDGHGHGGACSAEILVGVPKSRNRDAVDDGPLYDSTDGGQ
jgi:Tol biopolymer transport system component